MSKHPNSDTCMNGISFWRAYPRVRVASHGRHTGLPRPISYFQKSAKIFKCWNMLLFCFVRHKIHLSPTWLKRALNVNNFCALIDHMKRKPVVVIPLYFEKKSDPQPRYPISTLFQKIKSRPTSLATLLTARRDHFLPIHEERARPRPPTWMQPPTTTTWMQPPFSFQILSLLNQFSLLLLIVILFQVSVHKQPSFTRKNEQFEFISHSLTSTWLPNPTSPSPFVTGITHWYLLCWLSSHWILQGGFSLCKTLAATWLSKLTPFSNHCDHKEDFTSMFTSRQLTTTNKKNSNIFKMLSWRNYFWLFSFWRNPVGGPGRFPSTAFTESGWRLAALSQRVPATANRLIAIKLLLKTRTFSCSLW